MKRDPHVRGRALPANTDPRQRPELDEEYCPYRKHQAERWADVCAEDPEYILFLLSGRCQPPISERMYAIVEARWDEHCEGT